ncbi:MAG: hypothetical protein IPJ65_00590 [Archangiaceae bacterium]|nr:hypothetical protein [Archangiaceae bacterium]
MKRALLLLLLALGCGPHDVESAFFDGGRPPPHGKPCGDTSECGADELCEKHTCDETTGFCASRNMCMPHGGQVCGCDGITYSTDCARRAAAVEGFVPGPCQ